MTLVKCGFKKLKIGYIRSAHPANQSAMSEKRTSPIEMDKDSFRKIGHELVDSIAEFIDGIEQRPVTTDKNAQELRDLLGQGNMPVSGNDAGQIVSQAQDLLMENSLFNGHPKFMGYITSSAAPIGALADMLAAAVNPNVGGQELSPIATEIEKQTIGWLCEFINVPTYFGGILVSGGNMANFTAFLAARTAKTPKHFKEEGISNEGGKLLVYCSSTTHTWVEKAAILFGLGTNAIRWIESDEDNKMDLVVLDNMIQEDLESGHKPIMVIGTAGDVSTGAVDDLEAIADICKSNDLWFHIDGAYGAPAAILPENEKLFRGMDQADSIALDPHKWLYAPLEAGCTLVKNPQHLLDTYSSHPEYYAFNRTDEGLTHNFYEYGLQNSRGFKALKVWMALQQVGSSGYTEMINADIKLSQRLYDLAQENAELEAISQNLSITTFRYIPTSGIPEDKPEAYLNDLNEKLCGALQKGGALFLSNAIVKTQYCLRSCIVNFRTSQSDIEETIDIVVREGRKLQAEMIMAQEVKLE